MKRKSIIKYCCLSFFLLTFLFFIEERVDVKAGEYSPAFEIGFWVNNESEETAANVNATCIDKEKHYYEVVNPSQTGDMFSSVHRIRGNTPENCTAVSVSCMNCPKNINQSNKCTISNGTFEVKLAANYMYYCDGVYEIIFTDNNQQKTSYYIILDGNPYLPIDRANDAKYGYYAHQIDLVDSSDNSHNVICNIFNEKNDFKQEPDRGMYQKLSLSYSNYPSIAIRMKRDNDMMPSTYDASTAIPWLMTGEKYYRVNGGSWNKFSESTSEHDYISPNLKLEKGNNLVEIYQRYNHIGINSKGEFNDVFQTRGMSQVLLIKYDGNADSSADSDTGISSLKTYSWAQEKGDCYNLYDTTINEKEQNYLIEIPKSNKYDPIIIECDTENPGATYAIEDLSGNNIEISNIGRYRTINSNGLTSFIIKVTSADQSTVAKKEVQVDISKLSESADLRDMSFPSQNAQLSDGETINKDIYIYTIKTSSNTIDIIPSISENATMTIDGKEIGESGITVDPQKQKLSTIVITSEDKLTKNTYHLLYEYKGEYPYFGISKKTKELAESMLEGYINKRSESQKKNLSGTYWSVYSAKATNTLTDGCYVYDVTQHKTSQATDFAAIILELCMIGENPYDFNGRNYVEELANQSATGVFGVYANNIWAYMAFKAAGYNYKQMDNLKALVKKQALRRTSGMDWSLDMSAWAIAALKDDLTAEEKADWSQWIFEHCQEKTGKESGIFEDVYYQVPNSNTHGCVLTGLNAINVDPESLAISTDVTPLLALKNVYMLSDGRFLYNLNNEYATAYNKDVIIALGDIVSGSNVWNDTAVTQEGLNELLNNSKKLLGKGNDFQNSLLREAYNKASACQDVTINGEAYYNLLIAAKNIDSSIAPKFYVCTPEDGENIQQLINDISLLGTITIDKSSEVTALKKKYDSLPSDVARSYVTNGEKLLEAVSVIASLSKNNNASENTLSTAVDDNSSKINIKKVTGLTVKRINKKKISIKWKRIQNCSGYEIWIKKPGQKFKCKKIIKRSNIQSTVLKLNKNKNNYKLKIRAFSINGNNKNYSKYSITKKIK